jgi:hypothetical protein
VHDAHKSHNIETCILHESRSEIPGKFLHVLEKNGEDSWPDPVRNEGLHRVQEKRNILHTIKRKKANWIGHILRRNCLLKHFIEGKIQERIGREGVEEDVSSYGMTLRKLEDIVN